MNSTAFQKMCQYQVLALKSSPFSPFLFFLFPVLCVYLHLIYPQHQDVVVEDPIVMVERLNKNQQVRQPTCNIEIIRECTVIQGPSLGEDDERVLQPPEEPLNDESVGTDV